MRLLQNRVTGDFSYPWTFLYHVCKYLAMPHLLPLPPRDDAGNPWAVKSISVKTKPYFWSFQRGKRRGIFSSDFFRGWESSDIGFYKRWDFLKGTFYAKRSLGWACTAGESVQPLAGALCCDTKPRREAAQALCSSLQTFSFCFSVRNLRACRSFLQTGIAPIDPVRTVGEHWHM